MSLINLEAERALIGAVLLDPSYVWHSVEHIKTEDFHSLEHRAIWDAFHKLTVNAQPIDLVTVEAESSVPHYELAGMYSNATSFNAEEYANVVKNLAILRRIVTDHAQKLVNAANKPNAVASDVLAMAHGSLTEIEAFIPSVDTRPLADGIREFDSAVANKETPAEVFPTKSWELNRILGGGLWTGRVVLLAGRAKMGKTLMVQQMAVQIAERTPVFFVSQEMTERDLIVRLISATGKIPEENLHTQNLEKHFDGYTQAIEKMESLPIYISEKSSWTIDGLRSQVYKMQREHGVRVLFIDYLGLLSDNSKMEKEHEQLTWKTQEIKRMAKDLNIAILAIHTLNAMGGMSGGAGPEYKLDLSLKLIGDEEYWNDFPIGQRPQAQHDIRWLKEVHRRYGRSEPAVQLRMSDDLPLITEAMQTVAERMR